MIIVRLSLAAQQVSERTNTRFIQPGLDRIDGTCVNAELLNTDELWFEHTAELMELLEIENRKHKEAEDSMSMMEFCSAYATGRKTTLAMRRAQVRNQWRVDSYATTLVEFERRTEKKPEPANTPPPQELIKGPGKRWSRRQQILPQPVLPTQHTKLAVPGVVLSCANGFVYTHEPIRQAFARIKSVLENEGGFYFTPEHAFHVTVATLQRFNSDSSVVDVDACAASLRDDLALARECARGPFTLVVDSIIIPESGDAIVALFRDDNNRIRDLRACLDQTKAHVPQFIHTTLARVSSLPSCSRENLLQRIRGIAEGMEIEVQAMDLVVEEYFGYMEGFPFGVHVHWNFEELEEEEDQEPKVAAASATFWEWLDSDQAMYVALGLVAAAVATIVVK